MRRILFSLCLFASALFGASAAIGVPAVTTVKPSSLHNWVVDTVALGNSAVPYSFNGPADGGGNGSFRFGPIGSSGPAKLEMQPPALDVPVSSFDSFAYDFNIITGVGGNPAQQFYVSAYVDSADNGLGFYGNGASTSGFYDCRYSYVPSSGSAGWNSFSFTGADTPVGPDLRYSGCASTLSGNTGNIRFFRINGGDSSTSDAGLEGAFDMVAITLSGATTTYDFEPETACTTTCYVDAANGNDAFGGDTTTSAKKTIQAAIDAVSANGTVRVLPGSYQEEASNVSPVVIPGTYNFGLYLGPSKSGVSVIGVDGSDSPITDPSATLADITTVSDANFGPDGVFVEASDVKFEGLEFKDNLDPNSMTANNNKTFEIFADGFTLKNSLTSVSDGATVYFNDPDSVISSYHIIGNHFTDAAQVAITGYTGTTGSAANREIKNNTFDMLGVTYPGISFNGAGTGVPWFVGQVGGATISGNSFSHGAGSYIRSRGTVVDAEFDWKGWFDNNTFDGAVIAGSNPAGGVLTAYSYDCGFGPGSCPNTRIISAKIQFAVDNAAASDTVLVKAGTYHEDVTLNKAGLKLQGQGLATTTISGAIGGSGSTVAAAASNLLIDGFTITRDGNNTTDWNNAGLNTAGISVQGQAITGLEVRNTKMTGNRTGIDVNNNNGANIHNNLITDNRTGMIMRNQTDNMTVTQNEITNNWTAGVLFLDASGGSNSPVQQALNSHFNNNNISGNWYGQVVDRQSGGSLPAPGTTNLKDFSANWWGTATPSFSSANSTEPGYAAQIPVAFGGSATPPGGQPDVLGPASGNLDFSPVLDVGTDTSGTTGFQGSYNVLDVPTQGGQTGATGRIQEAAGLLTGTVINVRAGTLNESDTLSTTVDLRGAKYTMPYSGRTFADSNESTLNGQLTLNAANIKVDGFSFKNHQTINTSAIGIVVKTAGSGAQITNNMFGAILADFTGGNQTHAEGVYLENGPDNVAVKNNLFDGLHGWASSQAIYVGDSGATNSSTGIDIQDNSIKNVTSDAKGAYGIQTNNAAGAGLTIKGNVLDTLTGVWVHAIAFEGPVSSADVEKNTVANLLAAGTDGIAIFFESTAPFTPANVTVTRNSVAVGNDRYGVVNGAANTLDAKCNWWGNASGPGSIGSGSGSLVSTNVEYAPWLLSADLDGPCTAISVNSDAANTSAAEGTAQTRSGSFNGSIASITADNGSVGTFVDNGDGTWSWSYTPTDNHSAITINVTGQGSNGTTATDTFTTTSTNANPTATALTAPSSQAYGVNFNISVAGASDPSSVDAGSLRYAFDCGSGYSAANYASASTTNSASCPAPAQAHAGQSITVKGKVFDKDGGSVEKTASVEILQPEISVTPASHGFGSVVTGSSSTPTTFTVKNIGTATLTVSGVSIGGSGATHFVVDTNNCAGPSGVLAASDECTVDVFFHPLSSGAKTASLDVASNDPITATKSATLTGTGGSAATGSITIVLDARPDGAQSFGFTGALGAFSLSDPANNTLSVGGKSAGQYVIQGSTVAGWSLKSLSCDTGETVNKSKRKITINLAAGENVTCTYTWTKRLPDNSIATASGGPYTGVGVYTASANASQTLNQAIAVGQTKSFYVHVTNNSLDQDTFNIFSTLTGSTKFAVKFFNGATDVTARVNAGTYNLTLNAGQTITIRIDVKALSGTPASATRNIDLTSKSKSSTSKDVVRAHVTRA